VAIATQQEEGEVEKMKRYQPLAISVREEKKSVGVVGMTIYIWRVREREMMMMDQIIVR
jgi:hypothetical protein